MLNAQTTLRALPALRSNTLRAGRRLGSVRFNSASAKFEPSVPEKEQGVKILTYSSKDVPWLVGSLAVFGGLGLWLLSPSGPNKKGHGHDSHATEHHPPSKVELSDDEGKVEDITHSLAQAESIDVPKADGSVKVSDDEGKVADVTHDVASAEATDGPKQDGSRPTAASAGVAKSAESAPTKDKPEDSHKTATEEPKDVGDARKASVREDKVPATEEKPKKEAEKSK